MKSMILPLINPAKWLYKGFKASTAMQKTLLLLTLQALLFYWNNGSQCRIQLGYS